MMVVLKHERVKAKQHYNFISAATAAAHQIIVNVIKRVLVIVF